MRQVAWHTCITERTAKENTACEHSSVLDHMHSVAMTHFLGTDDKARHRGKQTLILIVDERPDICDMLSQALAIVGYRVTTTTGEVAWVERIKQSDDPPALVLLDLSQTSSDAAVYLADLRARWQTPPPLLVMTTSKHIYHELTAAGEPVLQKPFHIRQLLSEVQKLITHATAENSDQEDTHARLS